MERLRKRLEKSDLKRHLPVHRTFSYILCTHIRTWLDEREVGDSRYVIGKGKGAVIIGLYPPHAAACNDGNMPTLTSASVWQSIELAEASVHWYQAIHAVFPNRMANIDRGNLILRPSPAVALSTVLSHPRDICLVRCQTCCMQRTIGLSFHFHMIDGSPPKACL